MPETELEDARDAGYVEGQRRVYIEMLQAALRGLGRDAPEWNAGRLLKEREEAIATLRGACEEFGDNEWPDDLHLSDIIEKHLWRNMATNTSEE